MKTLLFIPMYNCEKQIIRVLSKIDNEVLKYVDEILVVNNRSTDNGEKKVIEFIKQNNKMPITFIRNDFNYGLGGSHKVAFNYSIENNFDYVIVLHGDDQGNIKDLIPYLKNNKAYEYDSFLGSRFCKGSKLINYSRFRIFGNYVFNVVISFFLGRRISDLGSGLNMYKVTYLKDKNYLKFIDSLTFNVYLLIYGVYRKSNFVFFPLTWEESDQISNAKIFKQAKEILLIIIKYVLRKESILDNKASYNEYTYKVIEK